MAKNIDYDEVRKLIALLEEKNLSVFELEVEGLKVKIGRCAPPSSPATFVQGQGPSPQSEPERSGIAPLAAVEPPTGQHLILSPMVGTFYRAPDPTAHPFTDIGETVKRGQTLCIIEAMKLMNEIEADVDGTVVEVFVDNAKPVEFGQKLFAIAPLI
ncbi:MAG: acetyl-CoA carboxylase biotin carboxyl carrier protein [Candidatus Aminicenantes bacterium]|nr:acetyl-CoA carboxylase biotin carboxyl carrier protein [Candidatus Aminicenantes bacterium]